MTSDPTARRATMKDVARRAGVSLKTVSRVVNGEPSVNAAMEARVRQACRDLGYRHNAVAASLRHGQSTRAAALIIRDLANPFYSALAVGAASRAESQRAVIFSASSEGSLEREEMLVSMLAAHQPAGYLVTPTPGQDAALLAEAHRGTPVVALDAPIEGLDGDSVVLSNEQSSREVVLEAIARGYRRFGLIADSYMAQTMRDRVRGALGAIAEAGLEMPEEMVVVGPHTSRDAAEAATVMLSRPQPPEILFCGNNRVTEGAVAIVSERRTSTAIIAFDGFALSQLVRVPLFVIDFDPREIGARGIDLLFRRLRTPGAPPEHEVVEPSLTILHHPHRGGHTT